VTAPRPTQSDPAAESAGLPVPEPAPEPGEPPAWLTVPEAAERLGVRITRVHQLVGEGVLLGVRRDGVLLLPADLVPAPADPAEGPNGVHANFARHLGGVLNLLRDARYSPDEALTWLYTPDDSLPGTPAAALRTRPTEVKRRAQALF
jgi:hypothetical protein